MIFQYFWGVLFPIIKLNNSNNFQTFAGAGEPLSGGRQSGGRESGGREPGGRESRATDFGLGADGVRS